MSGKKSRTKGARFELFLEKAFKACFPDARRMGGSQSRDPKYCDVEGTPFRVEAKRWAKLTYKNILDALEQAEENGKRYDDDRIPIAITRIDYAKEEIVHITLRNFLALIEKHFWREPELADVIPIRGATDEDSSSR